MTNEQQSDPHGIGWAVKQLQAGYRVQRRGWNGKDMWLAYSPGTPPNRDYAIAIGRSAPVLPSIKMKTATGEILMGWLASQTDLLAVDWQLA